jgi:hypothetical protein
MSIFWWVLVLYVLWAIAGGIRVIMLLGHKNHKDTLFDKIIITGIMPIAYIMGIITHIGRMLEKRK